jgi:hypothetical protein
MLEDVEGLNSYISLRLPSKLKLKENYSSSTVMDLALTCQD